MRFTLLAALLLTLNACMAPEQVIEPTLADPAYRSALEKIEAARIENATHLSLSGMDLAAVPPEIGQLTDFDLARNQLTTIPTELAGIGSLRLACNAFVDVDPEIERIIVADENALSAHWGGTLPCRGYAGPLNNFIPAGAPPSPTPTP